MWKDKTPAEIRKELGDAYATLNKLKFDIALGKAKNVRGARKVRKTIAQLRTIAQLGQKEL